MRAFRLMEARTGRCLLPKLEAAERLTERFMGLMGRSALAPDAGLYLPRCSSIHMFFMRFPIDVLYLDKENRVKKIVRRLKPWRLSGCFRAHSVIEAAAGWADEVGLNEGTEVTFEPTAEAPP